MTKLKFVVFACVALFLSSSVLVAQDLEKTAKNKIVQLEKLIKKAEKKGINTLKEKTTVRSSEIFLGYAKWDEKNYDANVKHFSLVTKYKNEPEKYAKLLPDFERQEIIDMLNASIDELGDVMNGKIKRLDTPNINWAKVNHVGDELLFEGKPVFLSDWTWKPRVASYCEYHGNQDGFLLTPAYVEDEKGTITPRVINELKNKGEGTAGFIFFNHSNVPKWAKAKYPEFTDGPGIKYTMYDINNPLARKIQSDLLSATVPLMAGKKYTELGYMLCNEPHWNTIKGEWAASELSDYAYRAFLVWLKDKHGDIATLNKIWGTTYSDFSSINIPKIMTADEQGTPQYFDFLSFNMYRVTEWFSFLASEVKKYDPAAKTHIKIMPNLWSDTKRDSGIDLEALTRNSDIIGNDASSCGEWMWGKPFHWQKNYSFDWKEVCMAYDFMKSVSPEKMMYNTEGHFLTTGKYRNLYEKPAYARCNYWLAHIHGLTAMQTWYWCRREDGSSRQSEDSNGYAGSNNHQPRIVNEVHTTMLDLNSVSDIIMSFQRQRKPIRVFYTKASSINSKQYVDDIFDTYEKMSFQGLSVGFATEGIINNNDNGSWDVIAVCNTPWMYESDVVALQKFVDKGGVVVIDAASMKTDEYGNPLASTLKSSKGKVVKVDNLNQVRNKSFEAVKKAGCMPSIALDDKNGLTQRGCEWFVIDGENGSKILNLVNLSKNDTKITISNVNGEKISSVTNVLTGEKLSTSFDFPINGVLLLEVK